MSESMRRIRVSGALLVLVLTIAACGGTDEGQDAGETSNDVGSTAGNDSNGSSESSGSSDGAALGPPSWSTERCTPGPPIR